MILRRALKPKSTVEDVLWSKDAREYLGRIIADRERTWPWPPRWQGACSVIKPTHQLARGWREWAFWRELIR